MKEFRITVEVPDADPGQLGQKILEAHGEEYDAAKGDMIVQHAERTVTIDLRDVTGGDADSLAEEIAVLHDAGAVKVSQREGGNWFPRDPGDDDIDT